MKAKQSSLITEAINLNEVSSLLMQMGWMVYRPEADVGGVDFLVGLPNGDIYKCQLKSRVLVQWDKYGGQNIYMVFPGKGEPGSRDWYLMPHDDLFKIMKDKHGGARSWNNPNANRGEHWSCPLSKKLAEDLKQFKIKNLRNPTV